MYLKLVLVCRYCKTVKGVLRANKGVLRANKGVLRANKGVLRANKRVLRANKGVLRANKGVLRANKGVSLIAIKLQFASLTATDTIFFSLKNMPHLHRP